MRYDDKILRLPLVDCWIWIGNVQHGYGYFHSTHTRIRAHRLIYEYYKGPIPVGLLLRHICHQPLCVNPDHLIPGTHQDNYEDRKSNTKVHKSTRPHAYLSPEVTNEIKSSPLNPHQLSKKYNLTYSRVKRILNGSAKLSPTHSELISLSLTQLREKYPLNSRYLKRLQKQAGKLGI